MRVTHIITRLVVGGAQENTVATVFGLRAKPDVEVNLISGPTNGPEGTLESRFTPHPGLLTVVPDLVRPVNPWKDCRAVSDLTGRLRHLRPGIVHTHSGKAGIIGRFAARRAGVPIIIHHIHGPSFGPFQGALANLVFRGAERLAGKFTTHFVCSAEAMARLYLAAGIGRPEIYTHVFSGFNVEPFVRAENNLALRAQLGLAADAFVVGKIARLSPLKGHAALLSVASPMLRQCPRARFLLVGDGPLRAELQSLSRSLGIADKMVFAGLVPPDDVPRYVGVMDALVHLSSREALSRALPQALAAAKPVVAYRFDGADEVCLDGKSGFLAPIGDTEMVIRKLLQLAADERLRRQLGLAGQRFVLENFRVEQMIDKLYNLYLNLESPRK